MKKKLSTLLLLLALCLGAQAQSPADDVIDAFLNDPRFKGHVQPQASRMKCEGSMVLTSYEAYSFDMSIELQDNIRQLAQQLRELKDRAYKFEEQPAGAQHQTTSISVEDGISVLVGSHSNHNYLTLYFRSPSDSLRRYANLLAWYNEGARVKGSIYKIYGLNPNRTTQSSAPSLKIFGKEIGTTDDTPFIEFGSARFNWRGTRANTDVSVNDSIVIANSSDFLQEFTRLYSLFVGVQGKYLDRLLFQNSVLFRMDRLVRQHGDKLQEKEEYKLCVRMLKCMKKDIHAPASDPTRGYVDIIAKRLKKTYQAAPK